MRDIKIIWDGKNYRGEWDLSSGDLGTDHALISAVMVSLFTDATAPRQPTELDRRVGLLTPADRRGWWGDALLPRPLGSRLWQLGRAVKSGQDALLKEAELICRNALQWLVDDGVAGSLEVACRWLARNAMAINVTLIKPGHNTPQDITFQYAWQDVV